MTAITDLSTLINRATGGNSGAPENVWFHKNGRIGGAISTGSMNGKSLWKMEGSLPSAGATPSASAEIPTNATLGALGQTNPAGGKTKYLYQLGVAAGGFSGILVLYDRLLQISGLSGTVTTAQTVGGTLTRNTGGKGNQMFVEVNTALGATATSITASYTNQAGASKTSIATQIGGTDGSENYNAQHRMWPLSLAAGDTGVQAVASVTLAASTLTAGDFGIVIARPIAFLDLYMPGSSSTAACVRDYSTGLPGMTAIDTNACLAFMLYGLQNINTNQQAEFFGCASFIEV